MSTDTPSPQADIAVIGGSGFYSLLDGAQLVHIATPYGEPSDPIALGTVAGRQVAFLARHGTDHRHPPHRINYRANLWALRSLGVRQVLAPCAVGSLRPELGPGSIVIPDQLVDRTTSRVQTYFDEGAVHVPFADPYCPAGRTTVVKAAAGTSLPAHDGGVMVVIEGPRFSTRAESRLYTSSGWSVVNMTGHPEAVLARELALCYTPIALVTDYDAGVQAGDGVSQDEVFRIFGENVEVLKGLVLEAIAQLDLTRPCSCAAVLDGITLPINLP
ncbi:S-methyl-5'-thioadenosine phosphorylase [Streptomyces sp. RTGN2]|uniref:S-methyl-5'-thioadenosine phosphorylase n=1 Tax=Streptomyces sp. RTGN2 TaxID=3016525 RepID=UPI002556D80B|nr:S-methyl-5'-thioadenosine phosphorylase [Streptomyces sp. RTGN2]